MLADEPPSKERRTRTGNVMCWAEVQYCRRNSSSSRRRRSSSSSSSSEFKLLESIIISGVSSSHSLIGVLRMAQLRKGSSRRNPIQSLDPVVQCNNIEPPLDKQDVLVLGVEVSTRTQESTRAEHRGV